MKVVHVDQAYLDRWHPDAAPRKARCCRRKLKIGEYVIPQENRAIGFAETTTHTHVSCLRELIADVPLDDTAPGAQRSTAQVLADAAQLAAAQQ